MDTNNKWTMIEADNMQPHPENCGCDYCNDDMDNTTIKSDLTLEQLLEQLDKLFAYQIEKLGNSDGVIVELFDGYGIRRANKRSYNLRNTILLALKQYQIGDSV